jgi:hypothetical protein
LFTRNDSISSQAAILLEGLVKKGRSSGIHIILASQSLQLAAGAHSELSAAVYNQMAVRLALLGSNKESRILADDNLAATLLSKRGEAILNTSCGRKDENQKRFQIGWIADDDKATFQQELASTFPAFHEMSRNQIVFQGNSRPKLTRHEFGGGAFAHRNGEEEVSAGFAGKSVLIKSFPTAAEFYRQSGRNLLVVGRNEADATGMLNALLASLVIQGASDCCIYVVESHLNSSALAFLKGMQSRFPETVKLVKPAEITELFKSWVTTIMPNAHRMRELRPDNQGSVIVGNGNDSSSGHLKTIVRDGPSLGIHVIAHWENLAGLQRTLDHSALKDFGIRIGFSMTADDSRLMFGDLQAQTLAPLRALLWDEDSPNSREKFIPFEGPSLSFLNEVANLRMARSHVAEPKLNVINIQ